MQSKTLQFWTKKAVQNIGMKEFKYTEKKDTRSGFGAGLLEAGKRGPGLIGLRERKLERFGHSDTQMSKWDICPPHFEKLRV